jgi:hypothetical protein
MELDLRGTPAGVLREYLTGLGGAVQADGRVVGDGWQACLVESVHRAFRFEFPRVVVTLTGDPRRVSAVVERFRLMAMRGGG